MKKYFVKYRRTSIDPEEVFLDRRGETTRAQLERLEFAVPALYVRLLLAASLVILLGAFSLLVRYQIVEGTAWSEHAEDNRLRQIFTQAPRGLMFDRYGKPLVENKMIFDVSAVPLDLSKDDAVLRQIASFLAEILQFDRETTFSRLKSLRENPVAESQLIAPDISRQSVLVIKTKEKELPGVQVTGRFQREYFGGPALSHVIGYTGRVSSEEIKTHPDFHPKDLIGRAGIEAFYDALLRGKRGEMRYEVDSHLRITEKRIEEGYEPGKNITLTIDSDFQQYIYETMAGFIGTRFGGGSAIALNPKTGEVLALVSVPAYDHNLFAKGITKEAFDALANSRQKPLFNRAVSGEYSSGSTIKPFLAAAALQEGIIDPAKKIPDVEGRLVVPNPFDPAKPTIYRDWSTHGFVDMRQAIAESCNVYFYVVGGGFDGTIGDVTVSQQGLGIERIKKYLTEFGWGKPLGIDLVGEKSGLVPDPAWKAQYRTKDPIWRIGDTYITSIGQGDVLITPLQLTASSAVFANGGKLMKPHLLSQVTDPEGSAVLEEQKPQVIRSFNLDPEKLRVIREGMRLTVAAGSARRLSDLPFEVAGKTGSVQVSSSLEKTNAVFVSFMPYNDPELVLTILVEGGGEGGATAVPLARGILTWYWQNRILSTP